MKQVLVVANRTAIGAHLTQRVYELKQSESGLSVVVVVPATPPSHRGLKVDADGRQVADPYGLERAHRQLSKALAALENVGVTATGWVGPADPMGCVRQATSEMTFDRIIVSTLPPGSSRWVAMDLPHRISRRYKIPVDHVIGRRVAEPEEPEPLEGPVHVLLVEDQPADIELTRRAIDLIATQVDLMVARNGAEAMAALRTYGLGGIDLVLLDLKMPVLDGHGFLEAVGEEFDLDDLNVVILTTSTSQQDRERAHALGAGAYVVKDPDFDVFTDALRSVVDEMAAGR
ncbi:MAG: response regulator [Acidimicrobiia bacterium]|nr:response regulator [Acidimicrobiia bacterium]